MPLLLFFVLLTISLSKADVQVASYNGTQGSANCTHTCVGTSLATSDDWHQYDFKPNHHWLRATVDMSDCGFVSRPMVTCSLEGDTSAGFVLGGSTPIDVTVNEFYVSMIGWVKSYGFDINDGYPTLKEARSNNWKINWSAIGYTC